MTNIFIPYGDGHQSAVIPENIAVRVVNPPKLPVEKTITALIKEALENPIGTPHLQNMVKPCDKVAILVNDQTRPGPNREMIEALIPLLNAAGVDDEHIIFVIATGSHRAPKEEELNTILGTDYRRRIAVKVHDCQDGNHVYLGTTISGLPVWVDRVVTESSFVIATGLIAPHHSAGFSGGRKSIVPGVAGIETLRIHHSLPIRPFEPAMGFYEENPFHLAALEAARTTNVRFIINAVQDMHKQNISCVAGDMELAHKAGVAVCREVCSVPIGKPSDVVITSPGGSPRDCNLYQSQKALSAAELFGRQGCVFIMCARAEDGIGGGSFREWMISAKNPEEIIERFRAEGYSVGSNKAFLYARALIKGRIIVVTDYVSESELKDMMMEWAPSLQAAVDKVCFECHPDRITVLPKAVNIIPLGAKFFRGEAQ
jgi:nickel-dependent lactate racemase